MHGALLRWTACLLLPVGCGKSHRSGSDAGADGDADADVEADASTDAGVDAGTDAATDAGPDAGVPCVAVEEWPDRDCDGLPDSVDPDPNAPDDADVVEDFDGVPPGWGASNGRGEWGITNDGQLVQTVNCGTGSSEYSNDAVRYSDVFVEARVALPEHPQCAGSTAGVFVRGTDGSFTACVLDQGGQQSGYQLVLWSTSPQDYWNTIDSAVSEDALPQWATLQLTAFGSDLRCRMVGGDDLVVSGFDAAPETGSAGLVSADGQALFDDFRLISLDAR